MFADSIYNRFATLLAYFLADLMLITVRRFAGTTGFIVQPRRWVVERSLGWLGRWRRLSKDDEAPPKVSEAMVTLAAIRLMLHRLVQPNRKRLPAPASGGTTSAPGAPAPRPAPVQAVRNPARIHAAML